MENESEIKVVNFVRSDADPAFYLGDMDQETIDLLVEDKIATGG